jgi:hypothetical protein
MPTYAQEKRTLSLATPLGDDVLLLTAFAGRETRYRMPPRR